MQSHRTPPADLDMIWHTVNNYCNQIESTVKNFVRMVHNQPPSPDTDLSNNSPILGSVSGSSNTAISTLVFGPDTKQVFLRSALTRELFQKLKRISKRWLANVPAEQRRQATKVAQSISKAIVDLRVASVGEKELATYKAHLQTAVGRECNVPMEQIRLAFSQKIRVYLQNTKSLHAKWVDKYGM